MHVFASLALVVAVLLVALTDAASPPTSPQSTASSDDLFSILANASSTQLQRERKRGCNARYTSANNAALRTPVDQRTPAQHARVEAVAATKAKKKAADAKRRPPKPKSAQVHVDVDEKKNDLAARFRRSSYAGRAARVVRNNLARGASHVEAKAQADAHISEHIARARETSRLLSHEKKRLRTDPQYAEQRKVDAHKSTMATASSAAGIKQPAFMQKLKKPSSSGQ